MSEEIHGCGESPSYDPPDNQSVEVEVIEINPDGTKGVARVREVVNDQMQGDPWDCIILGAPVFVGDRVDAVQCDEHWEIRDDD